MEGTDPKKLLSYDSHDQDFDPIGTCDRLIEEWADSPTIQKNAEYACYVQAIDMLKFQTQGDLSRMKSTIPQCITSWSIQNFE